MKDLPVTYPMMILRLQKRWWVSQLTNYLSRLDAMDAKFDAKFDAMNAKFDAKFEAIDASIGAVLDQIYRL